MEELNALSYQIIGSVYDVYNKLGPGLLESTYEVCLEYELRKKKLIVERQSILPIIYDTIKLDAGYRVDLLVEDTIIVEIKAIDHIAPIHKAQLMTYLKLSKLQLGLLINFNEKNIRNGIKRIIM